MKKLYIFGILWLFGLNPLTQAAHILSGSIKYKCLGGDMYEITLEIYRDCTTNGAPFDNPAAIAIYSGDTFLSNNAIPLNGGIIEIVPNPSGTCPPIFPTYCVEVGTYTFTTTLPEISDIYTVVYQRCCWSADFSNIDDPTNKGITLKTEISPEAQSLCNDQPDFSFQLTVPVCVNEPVSLPLGEIDAEGDSLVYELCDPLQGGGPLGSPGYPGDPNDCEGVFPDPPCAPPFQLLPFTNGFNFLDPFPTQNGININEVTSTFEFTPNVVGRFVYAFCVKEYRNDQIIGDYVQNLELSVFPDVVSVVEQLKKPSWSISAKLQNQFTLSKKETASKKTWIKVFDVNGQLINESTFQNSNEVSITTQSLRRGIYLIHIQEPGSSQTLKYMHF